MKKKGKERRQLELLQLHFLNVNKFEYIGCAKILFQGSYSAKQIFYNLVCNQNKREWSNSFSRGYETFYILLSLKGVFLVRFSHSNDVELVLPK